MLPQKSEVVVYTGVTALQKKLYKGILVKDSSIFGNSQSKTRVLNTLMQVWIRLFSSCYLLNYLLT